MAKTKKVVQFGKPDDLSWVDDFLDIEDLVPPALRKFFDMQETFPTMVREVVRKALWEMFVSAAEHGQAYITGSDDGPCIRFVCWEALDPEITFDLGELFDDLIDNDNEDEGENEEDTARHDEIRKGWADFLESYVVKLRERKS